MVETEPQDLGAGGLPPTSNTRSLPVHPFLPVPEGRRYLGLDLLTRCRISRSSATWRKALDQANRDDLAQLYDALGVAVAYDHRAHAAEVSITPAQHGLAHVSEEERTLTTRLDLSARTFIDLPG